MTIMQHAYSSWRPDMVVGQYITIILFFSVRDVVAGDYITIIRTYSPVAEYFGHFDGRNVNTLQAANSTARDVMARGYNAQRTWGTVQLRC